ncbi:MAG TPA: GAF domain-containing protein [Tepidisphaeraceae bacterium]|nr:GAF domain-containing protein [Tepidisphaeraceae bacterium]
MEFFRSGKSETSLDPDADNPAALMPAPRLFSRDGRGWPAVAAIAILIFILAVTSMLWHHERAEVRINIRQDGQLVCAQVVERFDYVIAEHFHPLRTLEQDIRSLSITTRAAFHGGAKKLLQDEDWLHLAALINPNDYCRDAVAAPGVANIDQRKVTDPRYLAAIHKTRTSGAESITVFSEADGEVEAMFVVPVEAEGGRPPGGVILYDLSLKQLLRPMFDVETLESFAISIENGAGRELITLGDQPAIADLSATQWVRVAGEPWSITLTPTQRFVADREQRSPMWILLGGIAISLIGSAGVWQTMDNRRRERRVAQSHLAALAALNEISLAITATSEETSRVFDRLMRTACGLLDMKSGSITLLDPERRLMHVQHRYNLDIEPNRSVYALDELPMCKVCMETNQIMFVGDVWRNPGPFNPKRYQRLNIRSIVVVPFLAGGKPLGAMVLSDSHAKKFTSAQRQMASLWGAQAAVTLSNHRLYTAMQEALTTQKGFLERLESLYSINTAIQNAETLDDSLVRMADLSPSSLNVDCTMVCLRDPDPTMVRVVAATSGTQVERYIGQRMPCCEHCTTALSSGKPLSIDSAASDPILRETPLASWGSTLFLPLVTKTEESIGVLILMRQSREPLSDEETRIAELFATRATVVIENTTLYEQTRRDADAKAMLLRELNHRVKNNLAAIVGLLSTKPKDMSKEAQRWVDRATQRIATMARTHDLFSGGIAEVSVQELARKALASVEAIKPAGVKVHTELDDVHVQLGTDRAVTLAMVLYELCCNALVHGMGEAGKLVLRGRTLDSDRVAIDVIDSGSPTGVLAAGKAMVSDTEASGSPVNGHSSGIGLSLVEGLVGRELHGRFRFSSNPAGGSTATVEFPVNGK